MEIDDPQNVNNNENDNGNQPPPQQPPQQPGGRRGGRGGNHRGRGNRGNGNGRNGGNGGRGGRGGQPPLPPPGPPGGPPPGGPPPGPPGPPVGGPGRGGRGGRNGGGGLGRGAPPPAPLVPNNNNNPQLMIPVTMGGPTRQVEIFAPNTPQGRKAATMSPRVKATKEGPMAIMTEVYFSETQYKIWKTRLPNWTTTGYGQDMHSHPIAHVEREIAEVDLFSSIKHDFNPTPQNRLTILDVGGNPKRNGRHRHTGLNIHCCRPTLTAADAVRNRLPVNNTCNHTMQECLCVQPDVLVLNDVLYYIDPEDLLAKLLNATLHTAYVLVHIYDQPFGTQMGGETTYRVFANGTVSATTLGNSYAYTHSVMPWLRAGSYQSPLSTVANPRAMAWTLARTIGDTKMYIFTTTQHNLPQDAPAVPNDLAVLMTINDHVGPINLQPISTSGTNDPSLNPVYITANVGYSFLDYLIVGEQSYCIPKALLVQLQTQFMFKKRDPETFQAMLNTSRLLLKNFNIPPSMQSDSVRVSALLSFNHLLQQNNWSLFTMLSRNLPDYTIYNQLLRFQPPSWWQMFTHYFPIKTVAATTFCTLLIIKIKSLINMFRKILAIYRNMRNAPVAGTFSFSHILRGIFWLISWIKNKLFPGNPPTTHYNVGTIVIPAICCKNTPPRPRDPNSDFHLGTENCKPRHGATLVGIGVDYRWPVHPSNCSHNEDIAVLNRVVLAPSYDDEQLMKLAWKSISKMATENWHKLFPYFGPVKSTPYDEWVKRFPQARRMALIKEKYNRGMAKRGNNLCKSFVKSELLLKAEELGPADFTPRLIQSRGPQYQAETGPWTHAFSKHLAMEWSHPDTSMIIYCSGYDARQLGQLYELSVDRISSLHGTCYTLEDDGDTWDGSLTQPAINTELKIYRQFKPPQHVMEALNKQKLFLTLTNKGGTFAAAKGKRKTGDGNTSCGNSILNALAHVWALKKTSGMTWEQLRQHLIMLVLGDDNLMFVSPYLASFRAPMVDLIKQTGIRPKCKLNVDPQESEFCSGRFYPSSVGVVFGPKIGRNLIKHGWARVQEMASRAWLKGVDLSLLQSWRPIPVLRAIITREMKSCKSQRAIKTRLDYDHHIRLKIDATVVDDTWDFVEKIYGVTRSEFKDLEQIILGVPDLPCLIRHHAIATIIEIDVPPKQGMAYHNLPPDYPSQGMMGTMLWPPTNPLIRMVTWKVLAAIDQYTKIFGAPHGNLWTRFIGVCTGTVYSVLMEEVIKRSHWVVGLLFPLVELTQKIVIFKGYRHNFLPAVVMHYVVNHFSLLPATALHWLFNFLIVQLVTIEEAPEVKIDTTGTLHSYNTRLMNTKANLQITQTPRGRAQRRVPRNQVKQAQQQQAPPPVPRRRQRRRRGPRPTRATNQRESKTQAMLGPTESFIEENVGANPRMRPTFDVIPKQVLNLSPCTQLYATSLIDPWSLVDGRGATELPCVPTFPNQKSRKYTAYIKTMMTIGSQGNASVGFAPRRMAGNYGANTSLSALIYTSSNAVASGATFDAYDTNAAISAGFTGANYNSEYTTLEASNPAFVYRLVCAGLRVRYAGTELNRGGNIHGYVDPAHYSTSFASVDTISQRESYYRCQNLREWCSIVYSPIYTNELEMQPDVEVRLAAGGPLPMDLHFMGFICTGMVAGSTFEVEAVASFEIQGPQVRGQTKSTADVIGMQAVLNTVTPQTNVVLNQETPNNVVADIIKAGTELTDIVTHPVEVVKSIAKAFT